MKDSLMWASRPDWWDIGKNYGPRTYTTSLEIKSLRDYNFISSVIKENRKKIHSNELLAEKLDRNLNNVLWSDKYEFPMNYLDDGSIDPHYYIGSLVPAYLGILKGGRLSQTVTTAGKKILDPKVGIYTVFPMDFEKLKSIWHFADDEEGKPFLYLNGGIWPHGNAWYALALIADENRSDALKFIKNVMTVKGIMNGPNGQPAMYEVRNGDYHDPAVYGKVDKPEFMWAAAWYINSIYNLYGIRENSWNIRLSPYLSPRQKKCNFTLTSWGGNYNVNIYGKGKIIEYVKLDGKDYPSAVLPSDITGIKEIEVKMGTPAIPYVAETNSMLRYAEYSKGKNLLNINLTAYPGHKNTTTVISVKKPISVIADGREIKYNFTVTKVNGIFQIRIESVAKNTEENLQIKF